MKIKIEIDLKPEEARKVMGLPEVETMQKELMDQIQEKIQKEINAMSDPKAFMDRYLPLGIQGIEQFQKMMTEFASMAIRKNKD